MQKSICRAFFRQDKWFLAQLGTWPSQRPPMLVYVSLCVHCFSVKNTRKREKDTHAQASWVCNLQCCFCSAFNNWSPLSWHIVILKDEEDIYTQSESLPCRSLCWLSDAALYPISIFSIVSSNKQNVSAGQWWSLFGQQMTNWPINGDNTSLELTTSKGFLFLSFTRNTLWQDKKGHCSALRTQKFACVSPFPLRGTL